ncbi:MAG: phosphomannomutase, partial [Solirubrobacteraceae bacterium]|nr:phosphomannomutase [Solirubrobacteraceae bacterium]
MPVSEKIFKAYDVRGLYGDDIDEETAAQLGRAFVRVLAELSGKEPGDLRVGLG